MNELTRALPVGAVVSLLMTACSAPSPEEQRGAENSERVSQELREWDEVQRIWRAKEKEGQGCEGEVLVGGALRDVVVGKQHIVAWGGVVPDPSRGASEWRNYHSDGTFRASHVSKFFPSKFTIDGSLLCENISIQGDVHISCFRLIKSSDGEIFEERLVPRGWSIQQAVDTELTCLQLSIAELETAE